MSARGRPRQPVVGVTCDIWMPEAGPSAYHLLVDHRYADAVKRAGGFPLLLPLARRPAVVRRCLDAIDGLVIVGGEDVDPALYGERKKQGTGKIFAPRLDFERALYAGARRRGMPVLGVCYGMQLINVLHGGTLHQDIARDAGSTRDHRDKRRPLHDVKLVRGSRLARILGGTRARVHSDHHQAVRDLAPGFTAVAHAPDGIVEAMEGLAEHVLAVQWHPERTLDSPATQRLFGHFVTLCRERAEHTERRAERRIERRAEPLTGRRGSAVRPSGRARPARRAARG